MIINTNALVLRTVPFGETSLVVTAFTEAYGVQAYMVKGARTTGKKGQSLRPYLQPGALLDLVVYHHQSTHLQYIRDMRWARVYRHVLGSVLHHAVAIYLVELLTKCLKQAEPNPELFEGVVQYLDVLDEADAAVVANLPLHFALFLAGQLGFRPENNYTTGNSIFDLQEGRFSAEWPVGQAGLDGNGARLTHELLATTNPITLYRIKMTRTQRQELLHAYALFFQIHVDGFGQMKSVEVLEQLFA